MKGRVLTNIVREIARQDHVIVGKTHHGLNDLGELAHVELPTVRLKDLQRLVRELLLDRAAVVHGREMLDERDDVLLAFLKRRQAHRLS